MISWILKGHVIHTERQETSDKVLSPNGATEDPQPQSQDLGKPLQTRPVKTYGVFGAPMILIWDPVLAIWNQIF